MVRLLIQIQFHCECGLLLDVELQEQVVKLFFKRSFLCSTQLINAAGATRIDLVIHCGALLILYTCTDAAEILQLCVRD